MKLFIAATTVLCLIFNTTVLAVAKDFLRSVDRAEIGRNGLWHVVHDLCVPSSRIGINFPCLSVSEPKDAYSGWAILSVGSNHILTIPTRRVVGIESTDIRNAAMPNLWNIAWEARRYLSVSENSRLKKDNVALAINSAFARTQDQLHIHTGCVRIAFRNNLQKEASHISDAWSSLNTPINGVRYKVKSYTGQDLSGINIFATLPDTIRNNPKMMARQALAVVPATLPSGKHGFYILNNQADDNSNGQAEALLDPACKGQ